MTPSAESPAVRARDRIKSVLEGLSEGVLSLDASGHVELANAAAKELLGWEHTPTGVLITKAADLSGIAALVEQPPPASVEFTLPNGRQVLARHRRQRNSDRTVIELSDVTELRRLESLRRDFVANVSHELRTPVTVIRANAETLVDGALDEPEVARELVSALHRAAERLSNIISDLLDLSRLESGAYRTTIQPIDIASVAHRAVDIVGPKATKKGSHIEVNVPSDAIVHADARAFEQIVVNYLDNAVKYTPAGGLVRLHIQIHSDRTRVCVVDNGPGIDAEHRDRLFERFYRVDTGRSREMGGTGLGLAIVKHLAEAMHARVGMHPAAGGGSVFWIEMNRQVPVIT